MAAADVEFNQPEINNNLYDISSIVDRNQGANYGTDWATFFGHNPHGGSLAKERMVSDRYQLPEAYDRRDNVKLMSIVTGFRDEMDNFLTEQIFPIERTLEGHFEWYKMTFERHTLDRMPEEAVASLVTSRTEKRSARIKRWGKAFMQPHGFMATPEGIQLYFAQLRQIAEAIQTHMDYSVLSEILTAIRHDVVWESQHGNPVRNCRERIEEEIELYNILQKSIEGLDVAVTRYISRLTPNSGKPDTLIIHPKIALYAGTIAPDRMDYDKVGERAFANFNAGPNGYYLRQNPGITIYKTYEYSVHDLPIDLLRRVSTIGEYNCTRAIYRSDGSYLSTDKDIWIYDHHTSNFKHLRFIDLLRNTGRFTATGLNTDDDEYYGQFLKDPSLYGPNHSDPLIGYYGTGGTGTHYHSAAQKFKELGARYLTVDKLMKMIRSVVDQANRMGVGPMRIAKKVFKASTPKTASSVDLFEQGVNVDAGIANVGAVDYSEDPDNNVTNEDRNKAAEGEGAIRDLILEADISMTVLEAMYDNNIYIPFDVLIARPYIRHEMACAILMKRGRETGVTLLGQQQFLVNDNAQDHTHYGSVVLDHACACLKEENIVILPNILSLRYIGGGGVKFIQNEQQATGARDMTYISNAYDYPAAFALLVADGQANDLDNIIDIRGYFADESDNDEFYIPHYSSADYYRNKWGLGATGDLNRGFYQYLDQYYMQNLQNSVLVRGASRFSDKSAEPNMGHMGYTFEGVKRVRNGTALYYKDALA